MSWIRKTVGNDYKITVSGGNEKYVVAMCLSFNHIPKSITQEDVSDWWHTTYLINGDVIPIEKAIEILEIEMPEKDRLIQNSNYLLKKETEDYNRLINRCSSFLEDAKKAMIDLDFKQLINEVKYFENSLKTIKK